MSHDPSRNHFLARILGFAAAGALAPRAAGLAAEAALTNKAAGPADAFRLRGQTRAAARRAWAA